MTEDRLDRYARGELTPVEARQLARQALDDPELFEDLTCTALAKAAAARRKTPLKLRAVAIGAIAAALIAGISILLLRPPRETLKPALLSSASPGQPVLLAFDIAAANPEVFRGGEPDSRTPQSAGSITSVRGTSIVIDLGSLDGLANRSELEVFREGRIVGRIMAAAVFRERARATVLSGKVQKADLVRVAAAAHLSALVQQADAVAARGDSAAGRSILEKALGWARSNGLSSDEVLTKLGRLELQAGTLAEAEQHFQSASGEAEALNALAVVRAMRGDYKNARTALTAAMAKLPKTEAGYARGANNLGVIAELSGERKEAKSFYSESLRVFAAIPGASAEERRAVERNLARVHASQ